MKFHCDRCKTRYSIADERVRGKILKIRCKNCSAVITVKEGGQVPTPASPPRIPDEPRAKQGASKAAAGPARLATSAPSPAARPAAASAKASGPARATHSGHQVARPAAQAKPSSALQGAFQQALRKPADQTPSAADSVSNAPATLDAEWYLSEDGDQDGPFELRQAQDWVAARQDDDELYCWSEGFDDWLPVEKVSHFRGLRGKGLFGTRPKTGAGFVDTGEVERTVVDAPPEDRHSVHTPLHEDTPVPLFAATMAQIAADAPTEIEEENPFASPLKKKKNGATASQPLGGLRQPAVPARAGLPPPKPLTPARPGASAGHAAPPIPAGKATPKAPPPEEHHEFEIGEASRVVKLPMITRNTGTMPAMRAPTMPGVDTGAFGRGTGSFDRHSNTGLPIIQGGGTIDMPRPELLQPSRRARSLTVPIAVAGAILVGVIGIMLYLALSGDDDDDHRLARGRVGGEGLAFNFVDEDRDGKDDKTGKTVEEVVAAKGGGGTARRVIKRPRDTGTPGLGRTTGTDYGEVDLGGGAGELDPDALIEVYRANKIGVTLCYNGALKRDPLLRVSKAEVTIRVGTTGTVSMVSIPSLSGTELGNCLQKRIKAWRFPKSSNGMETRFPIVFDS
jgi:predicted Zn finger-like uncharacterized protein